MIPEVTSLCDSPLGPACETIEPILSGVTGTLERIVSRGQPSAEGFWYDQPEAEWVALLEGTATLEFENGTLELKPGDSLTIPPHLRHRVAAVSRNAIWLAFHHR